MRHQGIQGALILAPPAPRPHAAQGVSSMNPPLPSIQRRALAASLVFGPSLLIQTWAQAPRPLTPRQTEGPFYPVAMPADNDNDLLSNGSLRYAGGKPVWLSGEVTDPDGRPVR